MAEASSNSEHKATGFAVARCCLAGAVLLLGVLALASDSLEHARWPSILILGPVLSFDIALCLVVLSLTLALGEWKPCRPIVRLVMDIGAAGVGAIATLTLIEFFSGLDLGLDALLFPHVRDAIISDHGHMSPPTAVCFLFGAVAAIELGRRGRLVQWLALVMVLLPAEILLCDLYGTLNLLAFGASDFSMTVPAASGIIALALGFLLAEPRRGLMRSLTAPTQASRLFRLLLLALLAVPAVGWLVLGVFGGRYRPPEFGVSTTVMLCIAVLAAVAWFSAERINRTETILRQSEERYRLILEHALEYGIFTLDPEGHVASWNAGAQRMLGYDSGEILGRSLELIFTPEDREQRLLGAQMERALAHGRAEVERWHLRKGGPQFWATSLLLALWDAAGQHQGFLQILRDRTSRKLDEEALRDSEARFRLLIEGAPNAMLMVDDTGAIALLNSQAERLFGYSRAELLGQPVETLVPAPHGHPAHRGGFLQAPASGPMGAGRDLFGKRKDGTEVPIEIGLNPLRIGERTFVVASILDITERKQAAAALLESEQRFALFMKHLPGAAWMKDTQGRYIFANETGERIFQRPLAELRDKTDEQIFPPEIAAQFRANDRRALQSGQGIQTIETLPQPDGIHHSVVSKFPIFSPDGQAILVGGVAFDITDRKQSEERALRLNETLLSMLEAIPDIVFVTEAEGPIQFMNPAAERFADAIAMSGRLPPPLQAELDRVLQTGEHHLPTSLKTVHRFVIDGQERFFLNRIVPMSTSTPEARPFGAVVMLHDVSEFRLLDEVKTNLISAVSHELKTPLTSLRTALLLLLDASLGALNAKQAEMACIARDEAERLLRTLNGLLDLTRFEESAVGMRLERVPPAELIQTAVEETRLAAETAGMSVRVELPPDLPTVQADRDRIVHVLTNFLTNAIKYSPGGSEILVRARSHPRGVAFSVSDRGPGVPPQFQSRIFERFVRVPGNPKKGDGLGLSIAREFVRAHRGHIGVHSQPGQGSEFYFILPVE